MAKKVKKSTKRKRPLSPHLTIYKPQITSVLSITHRLTGIFLFLGAFIFVWELAAAAKGGKAFECYIGFATSWVGLSIATLWIISLFYHLFNGIRHLFWDMGYGFELRTVTISGILVILGTILCSMALLFTLFNVHVGI